MAEMHAVGVLRWESDVRVGERANELPNSCHDMITGSSSFKVAKNDLVTFPPEDKACIQSAGVKDQNIRFHQQSAPSTENASVLPPLSSEDGCATTSNAKGCNASKWCSIFIIGSQISEFPCTL